MDSDFGDAIASTPQPRNRLENRRSKNNKISREVQKAMETGAREVRMAKAKEGGGQGRSWKKTGRERKEEAKGEEDGRSKKSSGGPGNLEQGRRGSKVRRESKETSPQEISLVD